MKNEVECQEEKTTRREGTHPTPRGGRTAKRKT
jgi:hypothetical protein